MREVRQAKGVVGTLVHEGKELHFKTEEGVLYKVTHLNLKVMVTDSDAAFYDYEYLDHAPETLGIKRVSP